MEKKIAMIEALANNQEFVASITGTESEEEMISVMTAYGIEMSASELNAFLDHISLASAGDELNEDVLYSFSGDGCIWNWIKSCLTIGSTVSLRRTQMQSAIFSAVSKQRPMSRRI